MNLIIIFHEKKKGWSRDYNFCFGGKSTNWRYVFLLYFYTHTIYTDATWRSWHGELIKMMFSLRGALRFFAFLWLFNLLFAMLVIAFTHSFPIFCNGSSYSLTPSLAPLHTHTHTDQFRFCIWSFYISMGLFWVSNPFERSLTIGNTHHHQQKRRKSAVMSASGK
jgi:hypothetical protein